MPLDVILLILRIAIALALYVFLSALFVYLWRDVYTTGQQAKQSQQPLGRLTIVECEDVPLEIGQEYPLRPYTTLGRSPTNTIALPDSFASTEHAHLLLREGQWWLYDQESRNGTTVNDVPITDAVVLSSGDVIGIGRVKFRLEVN